MKQKKAEIAARDAQLAELQLRIDALQKQGMEAKKAGCTSNTQHGCR